MYAPHIIPDHPTRVPQFGQNCLPGVMAVPQFGQKAAADETGTAVVSETCGTPGVLPL